MEKEFTSYVMRRSRKGQHLHGREWHKNSLVLRDDGLLYCLTEGLDRICIPTSLQVEISQLGHDDSAHTGIERAYRKLRERDLVYASGIDLERFISCCPIYQLSKPSYHKFYGELMSLVTPRETFLIDFYFTIGLPVA